MAPADPGFPDRGDDARAGRRPLEFRPAGWHHAWHGTAYDGCRHRACVRGIRPHPRRYDVATERIPASAAPALCSRSSSGALEGDGMTPRVGRALAAAICALSLIAVIALDPGSPLRPLEDRSRAGHRGRRRSVRSADAGGAPGARARTASRGGPRCDDRRLQPALRGADRAPDDLARGRPPDRVAPTDELGRMALPDRPARRSRCSRSRRRS